MTIDTVVGFLGATELDMAFDALSTDTDLDFLDLDLYPPAEPFCIRMDNEVIRFSGRTGNTAHVAALGRGWDGTTPARHKQGSEAVPVVSKTKLNALVELQDPAALDATTQHGDLHIDGTIFAAGLDASAPVRGPLYDMGGAFFHLAAYTPPDYRQGTGSMTSGSAVLTSPDLTFTADDVGKGVSVENALGADHPLVTTIAAFTNSTTVTLVKAATNTVPGPLDLEPPVVGVGTEAAAGVDAIFAKIKAQSGKGTIVVTAPHFYERQWIHPTDQPPTTLTANVSSGLTIHVEDASGIAPNRALVLGQNTANTEPVIVATDWVLGSGPPYTVTLNPATPVTKAHLAGDIVDPRTRSMVVGGITSTEAPVPNGLDITLLSFDPFAPARKGTFGEAGGALVMPWDGYVNDGAMSEAKFDLRGGHLKIDGVAIRVPGHDYRPIAKPTGATLSWPDPAVFTEQPAYPANFDFPTNDLVVWGGNDDHANGGPDGWFLGFGSYLRGGKVTAVRRVSVLGSDANDIPIENVAVFQSGGNHALHLPGGALIEADPAAALPATSVRARNNTFEILNVNEAIKVPSGNQRWTVEPNSYYDDSRATLIALNGGVGYAGGTHLFTVGFLSPGDIKAGGPSVDGGYGHSNGWTASYTTLHTASSGGDVTLVLNAAPVLDADASEIGLLIMRSDNTTPAETCYATVVHDNGDGTWTLTLNSGELGYPYPSGARVYYGPFDNTLSGALDQNYAATEPVSSSLAGEVVEAGATRQVGVGGGATDVRRFHDLNPLGTNLWLVPEPTAQNSIPGYLTIGQDATVVGGASVGVDFATGQSQGAGMSVNSVWTAAANSGPMLKPSLGAHGISGGVVDVAVEVSPLAAGNMYLARLATGLSATLIYGGGVLQLQLDAADGTVVEQALTVAGNAVFESPVTFDTTVTFSGALSAITAASLTSQSTIVADSDLATGATQGAGIAAISVWSALSNNGPLLQPAIGTHGVSTGAHDVAIEVSPLNAGNMYLGRLGTGTSQTLLYGGGVTQIALSSSAITLATVPTLPNQTAGQVWAGPATGVAAAPGFRYLVATDIPALDAGAITSGVFTAARLPAATTSTQGAVILSAGSTDVSGLHVVLCSDARLSDARTPTAHMSSHVTGGADDLYVYYGLAAASVAETWSHVAYVTTVTLNSGFIHKMYFTANKSFPATKFIIACEAAASGVTHCIVGLSTVDGSNNTTAVAQTADDTTLLTSISATPSGQYKGYGNYQPAIANDGNGHAISSYNIVAGTRYCLELMQVASSTATVPGNTAPAALVFLGNPFPKSASLSAGSQTTIPSSYLDSNTQVNSGAGVKQIFIGISA